MPSLAWALSQLPDLTLEDARRATILLGASYRLERLTGIKISGHIPHTRFRDFAIALLKAIQPTSMYDEAFAIGMGVESTNEAVEIALHGYSAKPLQSDLATAAATPDELTAQQWLIAQMVADGLSNPEIATELQLSSRTIEHHVANIYRAIGMQRGVRSKLVAWVMRHKAAMPTMLR